MVGRVDGAVLSHHKTVSNEGAKFIRSSRSLLPWKIRLRRFLDIKGSYPLGDQLLLL